jgi:hypothetical protein
MGDIRNNSILVRKPEAKRSLGRIILKWMSKK